MEEVILYASNGRGEEVALRLPTSLCMWAPVRLSSVSSALYHSIVLHFDPVCMR